MRGASVAASSAAVCTVRITPARVPSLTAALLTLTLTASAQADVVVAGSGEPVFTSSRARRPRAKGPREPKGVRPL